jgi:16S rRNA (uracil1498-N3)-methyltransferase
MTPEVADELRRADAHVLVDDVGVPTLDDRQVHHVFRVLRVGAGDVVTVTDGVGGWRRCRAVAGSIEADGDVGFVPRRTRPVEVAFAIPKQDRPEWIVQKLTELGVDRIVLLHAERSVVRWDGQRAEKHLGRLRRVAAEALQQSRGVWLPEVEGPLSAREVVADWAVAEPGGRPIGGDDHRIAVGPEGGWSAAELDAARDHLALGASVLRVETAALSAAVRLVGDSR